MSADQPHGHGEDSLQGTPVRIGRVASSTTVGQLIDSATNCHAQGVGNAIESTFTIETEIGPYQIHLHLCVKIR